MFIAKGNLQQYFRLVMQTRIGHFMVSDIVSQQVAHFHSENYATF